MIINGISQGIKDYAYSHEIEMKDVAASLKISEGTFFNILKTENVAKTEVFIKIFKMLGLSVDEFLKNKTMPEINNTVNQNNGTIQNTVNKNSRGELELIIEHQKKEIASLQKLVKQLEKNIELLEKSNS